jgi:hypothetical protein
MLEALNTLGLVCVMKGDAKGARKAFSRAQTLFEQEGFTAEAAGVARHLAALPS